jgi:hypothetical protein
MLQRKEVFAGLRGSDDFIPLESASFMRSIAERAFLAVSTTTQSEGFFSGEVVTVPFRIVERDRSRDEDRSVGS